MGKTYSFYSWNIVRLSQLDFVHFERFFNVCYCTSVLVIDSSDFANFLPNFSHYSSHNFPMGFHVDFRSNNSVHNSFDNKTVPNRDNINCNGSHKYNFDDWPMSIQWCFRYCWGSACTCRCYSYTQETLLWCWFLIFLWRYCLETFLISFFYRFISYLFFYAFFFICILCLLFLTYFTYSFYLVFYVYILKLDFQLTLF